jgi:putative restriction endonuclease
LNEPDVKYKRLVSVSEEDVFVRNGFFKKLILKIYGNQCSFTGMTLSSSFGHSFVDACHIVPFSLTHNDKVTNGISLCPNLHRAFDRGLVSISNEYSIIVSRHLIENESHIYALKTLEGRKLILPSIQRYYPDSQAIEWHRDNVFKG